MSLPEIIAVGAGGLVLGKLINLALDRLPPEWASLAAAGARRDHSWIMGLLPLVGHLWSSRRSSPVHRLGRLRPPAVEAVATLVCGGTTHQLGLTPGTPVVVIYSALLIHLTVADLEHSMILNWVVLPAIPLGLALFPLNPLSHGWSLDETYIRSVGRGAVGFGLMLLVHVASRGRVGGGDIKLAGFRSGRRQQQRVMLTTGSRVEPGRMKGVLPKAE